MHSVRVGIPGKKGWSQTLVFSHTLRSADHSQTHSRTRTETGPEGLFTKRNTSYKVQLAKMNMPEIPYLNKENC